MTPLGRIIKQIIESEGPVSIERFMALSLGDPRYGYYMTRDPFGAKGDFITAPEISQIFGELIGLWCADLWLRAGSPKPFSLVELGPGRGTLMKDVLRATKSIPDMNEALTVTLIEISPVLREHQKKILHDAHPTIMWGQDISSVPKVPTLFLANEFFDALPIRQYQMGSAGWHERLIGLDADGELCFGLSEQIITPVTRTGAKDAIFEHCAIGEAILREMALHLNAYGGAGLAIDYGYTETQFGDTFQAIKDHDHVSPLLMPGEADLTAHVNFKYLSVVAHANGLVPHGPVIQAEFLERLGIAVRAEKLLKNATIAQSQDIFHAVTRLTDRTSKGMGQLFKALAFRSPTWPIPSGF
jgi:NADH dehydrogenase [ubiquinone] 1 alpha subcomplex assembly factor 7